MPHQEDRVESEVGKTEALDYLIALPGGYKKGGEAVPLILFLHGAGERGSDLDKVKLHGPPKMVEQGHDFGAVVVSPQCPPDTYWPEHVELLGALLDRVEERYNIDDKRIYVTGLSMGGYGTFALAAHQPERFAAAVPICGGGSWLEARRLGELPLWAFHGDADQVIPIEESRQMIGYLKKIGNKQARLTTYPGVGHDSWTKAYADEAMWEWLFEQRRSK